VRLDVSRLRVARRRRLARLAVVASLICTSLAAGVGPAVAQAGDCQPPTYAMVVDDEQPTVLSATPGCADGRYVYDESWTATYAPLGNENGTGGLPLDVRDATPAADGGWWLLGDAALYHVDAEWQATGETVTLPTANGTEAATPNETGEFAAVARDGSGRFWLSNRTRGLVVLDGESGEANATDLRHAMGLYADDGSLWTLRGAARGGRVTAYELDAAGGVANVTPTAARSVRIGPEVRRPADFARTADGWLVVSEERNLFVYEADWTYTGERHGSSGLFAAVALLSPAMLLVAFGGVVVWRLRPSMLGRFVFVAATSTVLAFAVRQSLLPPAARSLYGLPGVGVAGVLLLPWALAVLTLVREGAWAVLAVILLLGAGVALPIASEYVIAV
jgi:hypothetical protein